MAKDSAESIAKGMMGGPPAHAWTDKQAAKHKAPTAEDLNRAASGTEPKYGLGAYAMYGEIEQSVVGVAIGLNGDKAVYRYYVQPTTAPVPFPVTAAQWVAEDDLSEV